MPTSLAIGADLNTAQELQAAGQSAVDMLCVWVGLCGNRAELLAVLDIVQSAQMLREW